MSGEKHAGGSIEGGKRLALVVGVNSVPKSLLPPLRSARQDAEAVAHVLEEHCHFTLLEPPLLEEQATSAAIKKAILDLLEQGTANDFLLFYFSGHGQPMDVEAGRNEVYLGTHDFVEKQVERDETLHLSLLWLRDKLYQQTEAGKVLLVLDCCYSGELGRSGPDPYLEELQQRLSYYFGRSGAATGAPPGGLRQALTATGHNQPAQEGQAHGRMTSFLLPVLRGEVPEVLGRQKQLTLLRLVDYLQDSYEEQPPLPALSGDSAGQSCILAYFPSAHTSNIAALPRPIHADHPASYLPFPRNPFFQPRPGEFEHLERLLFATHNQPSVHLGLVGVTGMGGIGKTQLAVELAYRYQSRFPGGIFWMPATGHSVFDWQLTLADLAVKTNFLPPGDDPVNPEYEALRARHLCRYFAAHADVLVILDNVEEPRLVTTALADLAGGALSCTVLYTSRQRTPPAGAALYPVEALSEEGALRLLLESTRPTLLAEVLAGGTSAEAEAARQICRGTGSLPLALTHLQSLLAEDRKLSLHNLSTTLQERGVLTLARTGSQQATLEETFQLSWQQVRDERARHFFLLASLFPEANPIPLWLAGLAAGLGERAQPFDPLWEITLSLQELSLLEGLSDDQVRLHPLVRAFGQQLLQQEQEQGRLLRVEAGSRLVDAFTDLTLLEQRVRHTSYRDCLEQLQAARDYVLLLDSQLADRLSRLERRLGRESYLLGDENWWPKSIPGLFYQQIFNWSVETGEPLSYLQPSLCWLKQSEPTGSDDPALLRIFVGHTDSVNSVAFSPDGSLILTGSSDGTARLWEVSSGRLLATLHNQDDYLFNDYVYSAIFSPDGGLILTGSGDDTVRLWDSTTGELRATLLRQGDYSGILSVAFSPDGSLILAGSNVSNAYLWETRSGRFLTTLQGHNTSTATGFTTQVKSVAFSPDGSLILTGSSDHTARLWETSNGGPLATLQGHTSDVNSVAFSPDGSLILTGSSDHTARLWDSKTGQLQTILVGHTDGVESVAFSPDGSLILTGSDSTARLWETSNGHPLATLQGHTGYVASVVFSPSGSLILTGSSDHTARLWETSNDRPAATLQGHTHSVASVAFSPDGSLILTGSYDCTACLWDRSSGQLQTTLVGHDSTVQSVAFSPDGSLILTGSSDHTVRLWEASSGRSLITLQAPTIQNGDLQGAPNIVYSVAFSPDGSLILAGLWDGTVCLWDRSSGQLQTTLVSHASYAQSVAFSPDGSLILIGLSNSAALWETRSGHPLATLQGHTHIVDSVAFSPDGSLILTGSRDHTTRLWEVSNGRLLATLQGHTSEVVCVIFSPDGQLAVTCDDKGWNFFWRIDRLQGQYLTLGLYITTFPVKTIFWQDSSHVLLADDGGPRRHPYIYRLSLEDSGWRE